MRTKILSMMKAAGVDVIVQIERMRGRWDLVRKEIEGRGEMRRGLAWQTSGEQAKAVDRAVVDEELHCEAEGSENWPTLREWLTHETSYRDET